MASEEELEEGEVRKKRLEWQQNYLVIPSNLNFFYSIF
jgi:hypothetical protein